MKKDSENSNRGNRHHVRYWKLAGMISIFILLGFTLTAFTCNAPQQFDSISFNQDGSSTPPDTEAETATPEPPEAPKPAAVAAAELSITKTVARCTIEQYPRYSYKYILYFSEISRELFEKATSLELSGP